MFCDCIELPLLKYHAVLRLLMGDRRPNRDNSVEILDGLLKLGDKCKRSIFDNDSLVSIFEFFSVINEDFPDSIDATVYSV